GALPQSTLGYEKLFNWGLAAEDEEIFVRQVLAGQPEPPAYFARMKRINGEGPPLLGAFPRPERLASEGVAELLKTAVVVDLRPADAHAAEHIPGTLGIPLNRSFPNWAGSLLPYDRDLYLLLADTPGRVEEAVRDLALIGLDRVRGYFGAEAVGEWAAASGRETESFARRSPAETTGALARGEVAMVDVRGRAEWEAGHIPGAVHIPLGELAGRTDELPRDLPLVVHCQGGGRSAMGASLLLSLGVREVADLAGGFSGWKAAGGPTASARG
nr:rhodanese-like domain-containing protein [Gemmatimonadota bacterium]